jgi:hypothetical protein
MAQQDDKVPAGKMDKEQNPAKISEIEENEDD